MAWMLALNKYTLYGRHAEDLLRPKNPTASAWYELANLSTRGQVHGFKPSRSRLIFRAKKILSMLSYVGEVKLSVPRR
jgi:hypothetical protein